MICMYANTYANTYVCVIYVCDLFVSSVCMYDLYDLYVTLYDLHVCIHVSMHVCMHVMHGIHVCKRMFTYT